jgi:hypothetical protein
VGNVVVTILFPQKRKAILILSLSVLFGYTVNTETTVE